MVHLGGDEVPPEALAKSPICNRLLQKEPAWRGRWKLYFMRRAGQIASRLGLLLQVWEDGFLDNGNQLLPLVEWNKTAPYVNAWHNAAGSDRQHMAFSYANEGYQVTIIINCIFTGG